MERFRKKGFDPSQEHLLAGVRAAGVDGASIVEIGCGVGYLHRQLLTDGAARATGVDLSDGMIREARRLSAESGFVERTTYHVADYVDVAEGIGAADVAILDRVICCYPHPGQLLDAVTRHTRGVVAYTVPRRRWIMRAPVAILALLAIFFGFRFYVHDPVRLEASVTAAGFQRTSRVQTFLWLTEVYRRSAG